MPIEAQGELKTQVLDRPRPLGGHELAFLRELLEGLPAKRARRHLFTADQVDSPTVDEVLRRLRHALEHAAAATGKHHLAAALPFDAIAARLALERARDKKRPKADRGLIAEKTAEIYRRAPAEGFSDEEMREIATHELIAAGHLQREGQDPLPPPRWNIGHARTTLDLLRPLVTTAPAPGHAIEVWFRGGTLAALRSTGVATLRDLTALILQRGHRWYRAVPRLGSKRAMRIAAWLRAEQGVWGSAPVLGVAALTEPNALTGGDVAVARASVNAVVPFDQLVLAPGLDGRDGTNRERVRGCILETANDHGAIERWLAATCTNANTRRAYGREAERLLLWSVLEKGKPLSSMSVEDCIEYREFLLSLADEKAPWPWRRPRSDWIAPRASLPRTSPLWKPFAPTPMKAAAVKRALVILRALFDWMVNQVHYLGANPWRAVNVSAGAVQGANASDKHLEVLRRSLGAEERAYVEAVIDGLPSDTPANALRRLRAQVVVLFAMRTGLRRDELARATLRDLQAMTLKGSTRHVLQVVGKGGKKRSVSLPEAADQVLQAYLRARGHWPIEQDAWLDYPLVAGLTPRDRPPGEVGENNKGRAVAPERLSAGRLYEITKSVFARAAAVAARSGDEARASRLKQASTHWLRHTFGTQLGHGNVDVRTIMLEMGHADIATTLQYISPDYAARFEQVDKAFRG